MRMGIGDLEEVISALQAKALWLDIGDVTSHPRSDRVSLSKDEVIDLMVDAYAMGMRAGAEAGESQKT